MYDEVAAPDDLGLGEVAAEECMSEERNGVGR